MSEIWYKITTISNTFEEVELEKETDKFVVIKGYGSMSKNSDWSWVRKTKEEAKQALVNHYKLELDKYKRWVENVEMKLKKAESL